MISGARVRVLAAAAALTCAAVVTPVGAECQSTDQSVDDAFAVAENADVSYLPFSLGEAQDESAALADRASADEPMAEPADQTTPSIVLAGAFESD